MATITAPEPPAFVDKTLELAREAGWGVFRKTAAFTLVPPDGVKAQRVTIKRTTPPTGEQLATLLQTTGFTRHMVELGLTGQSDAEPEPEEPETKPEASKNYPCPECSKPFVRPAALGAHRSRAHGVKGANTKRKKGQPKPDSAPAAPAPAIQAPTDEPETTSALVPAQRRQPQPSALEQHVSRFSEQVHRTALALCDEVTSEMSRAIAEKDKRIEELTAEVAELQAFKDAILGAVSSSQEN
ncbi:hypothetical protein ACFQ6C_26470 [Streptomyces sp. NPDC056454]|uniref:hypothetical protein n=1 Tax=Streptomyces sp. NPDC056454 TaxID=3345823 RepID=UPI00367F4927